MKQSNEVMKFNPFDNVLIKLNFDCKENGKVTTVLEYRCNGYYYCSDGGTYSESELEITDLPSSDVIEEQPEDIQLSQAELQFLVKYLASGLSLLSANTDYHKRESSRHWKNCNKESGLPEHSFNMLNIHKDYLKADKNRFNKLASIQRKLKKQMS